MSLIGTVGVVGLGNMGGAMAEHLVDEGWTSVGYDENEEELAAAADYGLVAAESAAEVAEQADMVITSLPTPDAVEAVYLGDDGIAAGAHEGLVALEMSTIDPKTIREIGNLTRISLLDAPVSGGPEKARDGSLTLMVGGEKVVYERDRVQAVFESLSDDIYHLGGLGAGHTTKLLNNQMGAAIRAISFEAAATAAVYGVDWEAFLELIRHSSGASYQFRKRMPRVLNRDFEPRFTNAHTRKDLRLALEMADAVDAPTPLTSTVHELYKRADAEGFGEEDITALVKLFEQTTDVPVKSDRDFDENFLGWKEI